MVASIDKGGEHFLRSNINLSKREAMHRTRNFPKEKIQEMMSRVADLDENSLPCRLRPAFENAYSN